MTRHVIPAKTRQAVLIRDEGLCRRCWRGLTGRPYSIHHRKLLSRGGDDSMPNLVSLCGSGTTGCHGWVHSQPGRAEAAGWMVPSWREPADVPITYTGLAGGVQMFLTEQGWEMAA